MTDDQPVYDDRTLRRDIQRLTLDWVRLRDTMPSPARRAAGVRPRPWPWRPHSESSWTLSTLDAL